MKKILILGGTGQTGKLLAKHLLEHTSVSIVLASRHRDECDQLSNQLNVIYPGSRVSALFADASVMASVRTALEGVDLLLVAAPTTQNVETVARAALEQDCDYLDVQLSETKMAVLKSMKDEIEQRGLCFITEAGYHPGLPSAMVRYAASRFDRIDGALTAGYLNMGNTMPYTEAVDELMEAFKHYQAQVFKDGAWTKPGAYDMRKIDFSTSSGEPGIGVRTCYSMFFEELRELPEQLPSLAELGFYIAGTHWLVDYVISPLAIAVLKVAPKNWMRPIGRFVWWGMQTLPKPPYLVMLKVEANGEIDGKRASFEASVSHQDGYELTAIPVVACLLQYLDGTAHKPGLWMMGQLVETVRLLQDMQRMGVKVKTG